MKISIVIPRYETPARFLSRALDSLVETAISALEQEVILIDSSREPLSAEFLSKYSWLKYVHFKERLFVGAARNRGIERASHDIICFFDSDCVRSLDWAPSILAHTLQRPEWLSLSGPVLYEKPSNLPALAFHTWEYQEFIGARAGMLRFALGCNAIFRKKFFMEYGFFREDLPNIEDYEIFFREREVPRALCHYVSGLRIIHQDHEMDWRSLEMKAEMMGYYRGYYDTQLSLRARMSQKTWLVHSLFVLSLASYGMTLWRLFATRSLYAPSFLSMMKYQTKICSGWARGFLKGYRESIEKSLQK